MFLLVFYSQIPRINHQEWIVTWIDPEKKAIKSFPFPQSTKDIRIMQLFLPYMYECRHRLIIM